MPTTNTPIFAQSLINPSAKILPADLTNFKTLRVGSANGDRIDNLIITSSDTVERTLQFAINDGSADYIIGEVKVGALSGQDGAANNKGVNGLSPANFPGLNQTGSLFLQAGYLLKVRATSAVSASKEIACVSFGGAY